MDRTKEITKEVTCYSNGERAVMNSSQEWRGRVLLPLLDLLCKLRISPNHLTLFSLLFGIAFCPLFFLNTPLAFIFLLLHILTDGIDGPMARHTGKASNQGSFTDTTTDQVVIAATTITLIYSGHINALPGGLYLFLYTMVVIFAMVRNALNVPYSWLVRPRLIVYAWFVIEVYLFEQTIDYVIWIFIVLLAFKVLTGFIRIRDRL